jgi:hypothetical protein
MKTYIVKTPLQHDGDAYLPDDEIALDDKHAEPLLAVGAVADPADAEVAKPARQPKKVEKKK